MPATSSKAAGRDLMADMVIEAAQVAGVEIDGVTTSDHFDGVIVHLPAGDIAISGLEFRLNRVPLTDILKHKAAKLKKGLH
jgi:hypothetical protein